MNLHATLDELRMYENSRNAATRGIFVGGRWIDDDADSLFAIWCRTFKAAQTRAPRRAALLHNAHRFAVVKYTCGKSDHTQYFRSFIQIASPWLVCTLGTSEVSRIIAIHKTAWFDPTCSILNCAHTLPSIRYLEMVELGSCFYFFCFSSTDFFSLSS